MTNCPIKKLSNNKLPNNKLAHKNLASELVENRSLLIHHSRGDCNFVITLQNRLFSPSTIVKINFSICDSK